MRESAADLHPSNSQSRSDSRLTDIRSDTKRTALERNKRRLSTGAPTASKIPVSRVHRPAEDVIDRFRNHHRRRHVRLDVKDGAGLLQQRSERGVVLRGVVNMRDEAYGGIEPLKIEVVFKGDGQAVEGSDGLPGALEVLISGFCCCECAIETRF